MSHVQYVSLTDFESHQAEDLEIQIFCVVKDDYSFISLLCVRDKEGASQNQSVTLIHSVVQAWQWLLALTLKSPVSRRL